MNGANRKTDSFFLIGLLILLLVGFCQTVFAATVSEHQIKQAVKGYIEKNMPWAPGALRLEFVVNPGDQQFSGQKVSWQVQGRQDEDFIGESAFNVRFYDLDSVFLRELPVRVKMEASIDVVVTTKPLSIGTVIGSEDVKQCQRWYSQYPQGVMTDLEEVVGKTLTTQVRANTELTRYALKAARLVRKGSMVKMLAETGTLVVTAIGQSQENGAQGEVIRVKNLSSNKIVYAKVIDPSLVKVEF